MVDVADETRRLTSSSPAVALRGVTKRFGDVLACDGIDLDLHIGEVHGVLGENGAGKSTLMKVLIGLLTPDEGHVELGGQRLRIDDPQQAARLGIGMVHQHFSLVDELSVWENVVLGERGRLDRRAARRLVAEIGERYGLGLDPDAVVGDLTVGQRQRVEIVKCLRRDPSIVIFDEPTSVLTPQESEQLFSVLRVAVREEGKAVALVSHKLDEVLHATDVVSILRRGRLVAEMATADADARTLAQAMVGRPVSLRRESAALGIVVDDVDATTAGDSPVTTMADPVHAGPPALRISEAVAAVHGRRVLDNLTLDVHPGEIVGVAGVEGNGQAALAGVLASLVALDSGTVSVNDRSVPTGRAGAMAAAGIGIISEDRHESGCVLALSVADNLALGDLAAGSAFAAVDRTARRRRAEALIAEFGIACAGPDAPLASLSGGNQQRLVLARELSAGPTVLVAAQPTRGLDVGAIEFVSQRLRAAADEGIAVLLISSELEEILFLADRIVVIHAGSIRGEMSRDRVDLDRLGLLMGGHDG
ncbi:MAG: ABC transporter ATP-binding protein [Acidimicrobiales bacterium]